MHYQHTLRVPIEYEGTEFYGGQKVRVNISPLEEDHGIIFETKKGQVKADIHRARQSRSSVLLEDKGVGVLHVEHMLATLFAYGIDNALVRLDRVPSRSYKSWMFLA